MKFISEIAPINIEPGYHINKGEDENEWISEGNDPQFILHGPFESGFWEIDLLVSSHNDTPQGKIQIYYAPTGDFKEEWSITFPSILPSMQERHLQFYLPFRVATIRLDPLDSAGGFFLRPLSLSRKGFLWIMGWLIKKQIIAQSPMKLITKIPKAVWRMVSGDWSNIVSSQISKQSENSIYKEWLTRRVAERKNEYPFRQEKELFSLISTVYDTPATFLKDLAESIRRQTFQEFEWIILDNGSSDKATLTALERMKRRDKRIQLFRVEENLGIIGGMSYVLGKSSGRYILPLDSDDLFFDDSLAVAASIIQQRDYPPLLYSDEDKLENYLPGNPFFKPDWDPVLLRNCCYIAHLCVIDREWANKLGVYADPSAEGCHDWDSFLKFTRAGVSAEHIPEIIYSWRMHQQSTAANISSKSFITESHKHVLQTHLEQSKLENVLEIVPSPFFPNSPDWWFRRKRVMEPQLKVVILDDQHDRKVLQRCLSNISSYKNLDPVIVPWPNLLSEVPELDNSEASLYSQLPSGITVLPTPGLSGLKEVALDAAQSSDLLLLVLFSSYLPVGDEWIWEAIGLKESFPDALLIGGRTINSEGQVITAGKVFGYGGVSNSPDASLNSEAPGYFGMALKQHSVSAVTASLCGIDPVFLANVCDNLPDTISTPDELGLFLAAEAHLAGGRVIYTPFITAETSLLTNQNSKNELLAQEFITRYSEQVPDNRYYNRFLDMSGMNPYNVKVT